MLWSPQKPIIYIVRKEVQEFGEQTLTFFYTNKNITYEIPAAAGATPLNNDIRVTDFS